MYVVRLGPEALVIRGSYSDVHTVGLIVPANSNLVLSGNNLRHERMFFSLHYFKLPHHPLLLHSSYSYILRYVQLLIVFTSCFLGASNMEKCLWYQSVCTRAGMVCHNTLIPFPCVVVMGCTLSYVVFVFALTSRRLFAFFGLRRATAVY